MNVELLVYIAVGYLVASFVAFPAHYQPGLKKSLLTTYAFGTGLMAFPPTMLTTAWLQSFGLEVTPQRICCLLVIWGVLIANYYYRR